MAIKIGHLQISCCLEPHFARCDKNFAGSPHFQRYQNITQLVIYHIWLCTTYIYILYTHILSYPIGTNWLYIYICIIWRCTVYISLFVGSQSPWGPFLGPKTGPEVWQTTASSEGGRWKSWRIHGILSGIL